MVMNIYMYEYLYAETLVKSVYKHRSHIQRRDGGFPCSKLYMLYIFEISRCKTNKFISVSDQVPADILYHIVFVNVSAIDGKEFQYQYKTHFQRSFLHFLQQFYYSAHTNCSSYL